MLVELLDLQLATQRHSNELKRDKKIIRLVTDLTISFCILLPIMISDNSLQNYKEVKKNYL